MDGELFYVIGIVLVIAALAIAYVGIRGSASFPPNRGMLVAVTGLFAAIVAVTLAFAVDLSVEEQSERNEELAHEEQAAAPAESPAGQPQASEGGNQQPPEAGQAATLAVASPEDGSLVFEPDGLEAAPGSLTIAYTNPSPVPHNLTVATADDNVLGETPTFSGGEETLELRDLAPGKYLFYCTVPGHREGGMEGDLTVGR